jgi:pimeloyl-ACP methyl ester carboxylesterase
MQAIADAAPHPAADPAAGPLLVLLPGAGDRAADFVRQGFIQALRERALPVDAIAADARSDYYLDKSVLGRLHTGVIAPARRRHAGPVWLLGISLGGMGAALYARAHPGEIAGLILLAPFFAVRGAIAQITRAGGFSAWQPGALADDDEEGQLLAWLKAYRPGVPGLPEIHLGYGTNDRYAPASALLAERLPPGQVATLAGGHDWVTWRLLWQTLLDRDVFGLANPKEPPCS